MTARSAVKLVVTGNIVHNGPLWVDMHNIHPVYFYMNKNYQKIKEFYNNNVDIYAKEGGVLLVDILNKFIEYVPLGGKILDVGSGVGQDVEFFYNNGYEAIGIDFSYKMIEFSKKNRIGGSFVQSNLFDLQKIFLEESFNAIWASSVITHVAKNDIKKVLHIMHWLLKFGGVIGFIVRKRSLEEAQVDHSGLIFNKFDKKEIEEYFTFSGLEVSSLTEFEAHHKKWFFILVVKK